MLKTLAKSLTNKKRGKTINLHHSFVTAFLVEIVLVIFCTFCLLSVNYVDHGLLKSYSFIRVTNPNPISVLVDEFNDPFHPDPLVVNVYKSKLNHHIESGISFSFAAHEYFRAFRISVRNIRTFRIGGGNFGAFRILVIIRWWQRVTV
jgi:hypothetical protein